MKTLYILIISLFLATTSLAQYPVQVGTIGTNSAVELPYLNQYDYSWSATLYPKQEINAHGNIIKLTYQLSSVDINPDVVMDQKIYMATTNDIEFTDAGYPNTSSMTLVFDGTIGYEVIQIANLTEIDLDIPFSYDGSENLIILLENRDGTVNSHSLFTAMSDSHYSNACKYNQQSVSFPISSGTLVNTMPIVYLGFDSGLDVGIESINNNADFLLSGINDLSVNFRNYMGDTITNCDIEWELNAVPQSTINWAGTTYTRQVSTNILLLDDYDFAPGTYQIKAWTTNANGGTDTFNNNDTITKAIVVADYIEIGDNVSNSNTALPFPTFNKFGWSSSIYKQDSLMFGKICGIAYNNINQGYDRQNQQIYFFRGTSNRHSFKVHSNWPNGFRDGYGR